MSTCGESAADELSNDHHGLFIARSFLLFPHSPPPPPPLHRSPRDTPERLLANSSSRGRIALPLTTFELIPPAFSRCRTFSIARNAIMQPRLVLCIEAYVSADPILSRRESLRKRVEEWELGREISLLLVKIWQRTVRSFCSLQT